MIQDDPEEPYDLGKNKIPHPHMNPKKTSAHTHTKPYINPAPIP